MTQLTLISILLFYTTISLASTVPCTSSIPMWCLDWEPHYQVWDPIGNKDYENLPEGLLTATLIDRSTNTLLAGPIQLGTDEKPLIIPSVIDDRIGTIGWTNGVHLHSNSKDEFHLRLILHAAPQYTNPELALPNQDPFPVNAEFHISGMLKLGDEKHVWLLPGYLDNPITFTRLQAAEGDTVKGFAAYVDFNVANGLIDPESLTLYIDGNADGEPERTIVAQPLTETEHNKLIAAAQKTAQAQIDQQDFTQVSPKDDWKWEWLQPQPNGNDLKDVCREPSGDLLAVDAAGFVLRRHAGKWTVLGEQLDASLLNVTTASDGEIYVTSFTKIWHRDGDSWVDMQVPEVRYIKNIYAWQGQQLAVTSGDGTILQYGPSGWHSSKPAGKVVWNGLWGATPDDVWITEKRGEIFRFDGDTWSPVAHELTGNIMGVWGFGPQDVYVLTNYIKGRVWHWSGTDQWTPLDLPQIPWANVPNFQGTGETIELWTGGLLVSFGLNDWTQIKGRSDYAMDAICRDAQGQMVGVGESGRTWEHNSGAWTEVEPRLRPSILSIWGLKSDEIYAACADGKVWQWDGSHLAEMDSLSEMSIQGIWGTSSSDIHAAGVRGIWHWDGKLWTQTWHPGKDGVGFGFQLWGSGPNNIWAVGSAGAMVHFEDGKWNRVDGVSEKSLRAIWGSGPNNVYVGGDDTLLQFDGAQWSVVPGFKQLRVNKLWGSGPSDVWATTDQGLLHYDGQTWQHTRLKEHTTGIWGSCATDVITSTRKQLLHFDGNEWNSVRRVDAGMIRGLWCQPGEDILVFGDDGNVFVLHRP